MNTNTPRFIVLTSLALGTPLIIDANRVTFAEPGTDHDNDEGPRLNGTVITIDETDVVTRVQVSERIDVVAEKLGLFAQSPKVAEAMDAWTFDKFHSRVLEHHDHIVQQRAAQRRHEAAVRAAQSTDVENEPAAADEARNGTEG